MTGVKDYFGGGLNFDTIFANRIIRDFNMGVVSNMLLAKVIETAITTFIMVLIYLSVRILVGRLSKTIKQRERLRARAFYIILLFYMTFLAKFWINGFGNIFTVLGLVSAALVVTNKETIMNFVAWFIISWRGLFSEGDYIKINGLTGYIVQIGPLYFTLSNQKARRINHAHVTKVPNGLVLNNVLINYSQTDALFHKELQLVFPYNADYKQSREAFEAIILSVLKEETVEYHRDVVKDHRHVDDDLVLVSTLVSSVKVSWEKPEGIVCSWEFDCYFPHHKKVENRIWEAWLDKLPALSSVQ